MSSNIALQKCIQKLAFLEMSVIVSCESGDDAVIDVTQDGKLVINNKHFKNIDEISGHLGLIRRIMTLNHETEEEIIVYSM
jgi:hypothetical protein